jgi:hypothetical protein
VGKYSREREREINGSRSHSQREGEPTGNPEKRSSHGIRGKASCLNRVDDTESGIHWEGQQWMRRASSFWRRERESASGAAKGRRNLCAPEAMKLILLSACRRRIS